MNNKENKKENVEKNMNIPANEVIEKAPQIPIPEVVNTMPNAEPNTQNKIPELHPVHKTRMVVLMVITIVLGLVSVISLLFALKTKGDGGFTLKFPVKEVADVVNVEIEKETEPEPVKKPGEFDPVDIVKDLDNLNLEDIEKSYLDSGLN